MNLDKRLTTLESPIEDGSDAQLDDDEEDDDFT